MSGRRGQVFTFDSAEKPFAYNTPPTLVVRVFGGGPAGDGGRSRAL